MTGGKVFTYDAVGVYQSAHDFDVHGPNMHGLAWDETYYRAVDANDDTVYSYDADGVYQSAQNFSLLLALTRSRWASHGTSTYYRVVDGTELRGLRLRLQRELPKRAWTFNLATANRQPKRHYMGWRISPGGGWAGQ